MSSRRANNGAGGVFHHFGWRSPRLKRIASNKGLLAFRFDDPDRAIGVLQKHRLNPIRKVDLFEPFK